MNMQESKTVEMNAAETTVEMLMNMWCPCKGWERKVKKSMKRMEGVTHVEVDLEQGKLTVTGYVDPDHVLERVRRRTCKEAEFWSETDKLPYVYAPEPYYNNTESSTVAPASFFEDVNYATPFSDDNVDASCTIM